MDTFSTHRSNTCSKSGVGVGPITALCFKATIDDPTRFKRSRSLGAYVGLTTRRHASGEIDWTGRISKCGDAMLRSYLFEAAGPWAVTQAEAAKPEAAGRPAT
jgi:transposase